QFRARARSIFGEPQKPLRRSRPVPRGRRATTSNSAFAKTITESAHGFDPVAGFAELFAQSPNVGVHRTRVDHTFISPNFVEQSIALLDAAAPLHQHPQKPELDAR